MDDLSWIAPTIAALSAMVVAIVSAIRAKDTGAKVDVVTTKVETVLEKAVEIHTATNGTLHQAQAATAAAEALKDVLAERVDGLEKALAALTASGVLAATTARVAAADVQEAMAVTPPEVRGEVSGDGER